MIGIVVGKSSRIARAFAAVFALAALGAAPAQDQNFTIHIEPAAQGTSDAVLAGALSKAQASLAQGRATTIELGAGVYRLARPLVLGKAQSGTRTGPLRIVGSEAGPVILTGNKPMPAAPLPADLRDLLPASAKAVVRAYALPDALSRAIAAPTPAAFQASPFGTPLWFSQGWTAPHVASWPNEGFHFERIAAPQKGQNFAPVLAITPDQAERWSREPALRFEGYWANDFAFERGRIARFDAAARTVFLQPLSGPYAESRRRRYRVVNALSELDSPGEMALVPTRRLLLLWPAAAAAPLEMATAGAIVSIQNAHDIVMDGIALRGAGGNALDIADSERVTFTNGYLGQVGGMGALVLGSTGVEVSRSVVADTGQTGIRLSSGDPVTLRPGGSIIRDNIITRVGLANATGRPGIRVEGVGQQVSGNLVHSVPRAGIEFSGNDHRISGNEIAFSNLESGDLGAFYTYANLAGRGTVLDGNYVHDVYTLPNSSPNVAVYLDGWTSGITLRRNLFVDTERTVWVNSGSDNVIDRNIFVRPRREAVLIQDQSRIWGLRASQNAQASAARITSLHKQRYPENLFRAIELKGAPAMNRVSDNIVVNGPPSSFAIAVAQSQRVGAQTELEISSSPSGPIAIARALAERGIRPDLDFAALDRRAALSGLRYGQADGAGAKVETRVMMVREYRSIVEGIRHATGLQPETLHWVFGVGIWSIAFLLFRARRRAQWWAFGVVVLAQTVNEVQDYRFWGYVQSDTVSDCLLTLGPALALAIVVTWMRRGRRRRASAG